MVKDSLVKIAIGSCHDAARKNNKIFSSIVDYSPNLYIWLGDAVYLDGGNKTCKLDLILSFKDTFTIRT